MEIKYTVLITDKKGNLVNVAYETSADMALKLVNMLLAGEDPNAIADVVIHPVVKTK